MKKIKKPFARLAFQGSIKMLPQSEGQALEEIAAIGFYLVLAAVSFLVLAPATGWMLFWVFNFLTGKSVTF